MKTAGFPSPAAATPSPLTRQLPLVLALALAAGTEAFTTSAVGLALPAIAASFAASPDEISWAVTLYFAACAAALPLSAWLSDVLGQRRYLAIAMGLYLLASLGCAVSPSLPLFLALRVVQGAAGAGFVARAIFTFTKEFRPPVLFRAFFILIAGFSLRGFGLPLGGYLVDHLSWRWLFAPPIALIGLVALPALALSGEVWPRRRPPRPDFAGLALLVAALGAVLVALYRGQRDDWLASPVIAALLALAGLATPAYFWRLRRQPARRGVLPTASLRYRGMGVGVTLSLLAGAMLVGGIYVLPQFLLHAVGCDATRTGWLMSLDNFGLMGGLAFAVGTLSRRLTRGPLLASGLLFSTAMVLFAFRLTSATPVEALYLPLVLHGFSVGLALPPIGIFSFRAIGANAEANSEGRAWHYTARQVGAAVAVALAVATVDLRTSVHSSRLAEHLTAFNPLARQALAAVGRGLVAHGLTPAHAVSAATTVLRLLVAREATVLAFNDYFLLAAGTGLAVAALALLLPGARPAAPAPVHPNRQPSLRP